MALAVLCGDFVGGVSEPLLASAASSCRASSLCTGGAVRARAGADGGLVVRFELPVQVPALPR
jgi:hypothetical protein